MLVCNPSMVLTNFPLGFLYVYIHLTYDHGKLLFDYFLTVFSSPPLARTTASFVTIKPWWHTRSLLCLCNCSIVHGFSQW